MSAFILTRQNEAQATPIDGVTYCSLGSLLKQTAQARLLAYGNQDVHSRQSGQHLSVYKGRGMDFAESRVYQYGDDVRLLDWRVTARTGKPHTKIFTEEREQPVVLMVDLRAPMFFGTRCRYKSVLAAELASLIVWRSLQSGDKAGGMLIADAAPMKVYKPSRSHGSASQFINALAQATQISPVTHKVTSSIASEQKSLTKALQYIRPIVEKGTQLILLSDFRGLREDASRQLMRLADRSSVALLAISDPIEKTIADHPEPTQLQLSSSSGGESMRLTREAQLHYRHRQETREKKLNSLVRHANLRLISVSTADSSSEVLLKLSRGLQ